MKNNTMKITRPCIDVTYEVDENGRPHRGKPTVCFSDGKLKVYPSAMNAAESENVPYINVIECLNGYQKTARKKHFWYVSDFAYASSDLIEVINGYVEKLEAENTSLKEEKGIVMRDNDTLRVRCVTAEAEAATTRDKLNKIKELL